MSFGIVPVAVDTTSAMPAAVPVPHTTSLSAAAAAADAVVTTSSSSTLAAAASPTVPLVVPSTTSSIIPSVTTTSPTATSSSINTNMGQPLDYTTTKWVETWIGGTYSTWTPTVITVIHKDPSSAPSLLHGSIGMSWTGATGQTQTVYEGAAPLDAAGWARGVVAAVGLGVVGMVV
ncbi:hypothetical protein ACEQ8H_002135 [Pleosporales sp. CAS-2024a]